MALSTIGRLSVTRATPPDASYSTSSGEGGGIAIPSGVRFQPLVSGPSPVIARLLLAARR